MRLRLTMVALNRQGRRNTILKGERTRRNAGKGQILILTNKLDIAADWVVRELEHRRAAFIRLNTEDLPRSRVSWQRDGGCSIETESGRSCDISTVSAAWFRRPGRPFGERVMQDSAEAVLNAQWRSFLDGALIERGGIRWINHPISNSRAESKMWQLKQAQKCGFAMPRTLVTNSAEVAAAASRQWRDGAILKALDAPLIVVNGEERFVFATRMLPEHLESAVAFATAPVIVQERLHPKRDIRVTVVGKRVFTAEASEVTAQDWRLEEPPVQFRPGRLSPALEARCLELVKQLGLTFGAIDLIASTAPHILP